MGRGYFYSEEMSVVPQGTFSDISAVISVIKTF